MNLKICAITMLACLMLSSTAFARDIDRPRGHGDFAGKEAIQHLTRALRRLDLSEEQKASVRENFHGLRAEIAPLVKDLHTSRKALLEQVGTDDYNADAVAEIAARQGALTTEITLHVSNAINSALSVLTDEQRAELRSMREKRMNRRMDRRDEARAERKHRGDSRSGDDSGNG